MLCSVLLFFFFFKQKTAYEMRISDWSSDVCSSDLDDRRQRRGPVGVPCFENNVAGHCHCRVAQRREGREIGLEIVIGRRDGRQRLMRVEQGAAVTGDVLDDADDAPRLQTAEDRTADRQGGVEGKRVSVR